jgi:hypothetical protein
MKSAADILEFLKDLRSETTGFQSLIKTLMSQTRQIPKSKNYVSLGQGPNLCPLGRIMLLYYDQPSTVTEEDCVETLESLRPEIVRKPFLQKPSDLRLCKNCEEFRKELVELVRREISLSSFTISAKQSETISPITPYLIPDFDNEDLVKDSLSVANRSKHRRVR